MKKDLIALQDLTQKEIFSLLELTKKLKDNPIQPLLAGKNLGLLFTKSSTRTRVSFEVGIFQLGGHSIFLDVNGLQIARGETLEDTAKVLSRYLDAIVIRTYDHQELVKFAQAATMPVINGLTDDLHPCQILSDLFTMYEKFGKVEGLKIAYVGDGANNMVNTWLAGAAMMNMKISVAAPPAYWPSPEYVKAAVKLSNCGSSFLEVTQDVVSAVRDADVIYTDVWVSMGQEKEKEKRLKDLAKYQLNGELLKRTGKNTLVMHCLPAHRGEEIADDMVDGPQSVIFDQAENRLHAQKALMVMLMGKRQAASL
jgi:ornithine carbamoyltransferase